VHYLSPYDVLLIHQRLLDEYGGMVGITESGFGRLETAVFTPLQSMFGEDLYPDLPAKAAALYAAIIGNHPFSDGNKRVALVALDLMMSMNGASLVADNESAYEFTLRVASGGVPREEIEAWVRARAICDAEPADSRMSARHLTLSDLFTIRDGIATSDPARFAVANSNGLLTALTTPFQGAFGQEAFPTLEDKAAALVFLLIANHPFYDGNKRIAGGALRLFLERNGCPLRATPAELRAFTRLVLDTHSPRDERLKAWVLDHIPTR
jgi:death-on-curing protein